MRKIFCDKCKKEIIEIKDHAMAMLRIRPDVREIYIKCASNDIIDLCKLGTISLVELIKIFLLCQLIGDN